MVAVVFSVAVIVLATLVLWLFWLDARRTRETMVLVERMQPWVINENAIPTPQRSVPVVHAPKALLIGPPIVRPDTGGEFTLREWLVHYTARGDAWQDVVAEFCKRAAEDPEIASYFADVDMVKLQRHFLVALMIVTHSGLTTKIIDRMEEVHMPVVDESDRPITEDVFDRTASLLDGVLIGKGVPAYVINHLDHVLAPLKSAIVRDS